MEKVANPLVHDVHEKYIHLFLILLLISLAFAVYVLVYETGGIKYVYSHSMYLPILFAGYLYGVYGGAMIGVLGGVLLGPFMPIDTSTLEQQETINWLYRGIFFVAIGLLAGAGSSALRDRIKNIQFLAHNDRETGLPNRTSTIEYLSRLLQEEVDGANTPHVLMKLACDNLMEIEVTFGFDASASVMRQVLQRLRESLPKDVFLSKTHHSEFAIVLHDMSMPEAAELARQLHDVMKRAFVYEGIPLHVETVMGYLPLSDAHQSADSVLQKAELAVMGARYSHQRVAVYDARSEMQRQDNLALLGQLRGALGKGDLQLYYQPKICLATQNMVGAEALMRWPHAERGMIPPDQFIPQAEQSSIINELTAWALHSALAQHVLWDAAGKHHDLKVAVNVSIHDLLAPDFSDTVIDALQSHAVNAKYLELELTESTLMEDIKTSTAVLNKLADANLVISIDDFGTGYSSLKYLDLLPVTAIKIDQSFTRRMLSEKGSRHIVSAAIGLAHSLGMKVIAEGIEELEVFKMLCDMGCDIGQGYFISRPLPQEQFADFKFQGA